MNTCFTQFTLGVFRDVYYYFLCGGGYFFSFGFLCVLFSLLIVKIGRMI